MSTTYDDEIPFGDEQEGFADGPRWCGCCGQPLLDPLPDADSAS